MFYFFIFVGSWFDVIERRPLYQTSELYKAVEKYTLFTIATQWKSVLFQLREVAGGKGLYI